MYARVTTTQFSPYRLDEAVHIVREQVVPAAQQQTGFKGFLMLADRSTGKGITITLWEGEEDRDVTGSNSSYYRDAIGITDEPLDRIVADMPRLAAYMEL